MIAAQPAPLSDSHVGEVFDGRYKIERLIGRGGMGLVYLARDEVEQRDVVLKLLASHWAGDSTAAARFEREGQRLAHLSHPNVVKLLGLGQSNGRSYILMEYVDGESLHKYLSRHRHLNLKTFAPIAAQIAAGVGYVHQQNIMLRDIKPPNIMLCEHGGRTNFVKLLDFGLAKLVEGDEVDVTRAHVVGTAGYLAPEQIKGEACDVRVDVYALGILFFTMLTGSSPIAGDNDAAVLYHHVHGEPIRLEDALGPARQVPKRLIDLVHRCLAKSPADRPANGNVVTDLLLDALPHALFELPVATEASRAAMRSSAREIGDEGVTRRWSRPLLPSSGVHHSPEAARETADLMSRPSGQLPMAKVVHANDEAPRRRGTVFAAGAFSALLVAGTYVVLGPGRSQPEAAPPVTSSQENEPAPARALPTPVAEPAPARIDEAPREQPKRDAPTKTERRREAASQDDASAPTVDDDAASSASKNARRMAQPPARTTSSKSRAARSSKSSNKSAPQEPKPASTEEVSAEKARAPSQPRNEPQKPASDSPQLLGTDGDKRSEDSVFLAPSKRGLDEDVFLSGGDR